MVLRDLLKRDFVSENGYADVYITSRKGRALVECMGPLSNSDYVRAVCYPYLSCSVGFFSIDFVSRSRLFIVLDID